MHNNFIQTLIQRLKEIFATKEDLQALPKKDDLKKFATKDDLRKFATKDDLKKFATKNDLKKFATKNDLKKFATKSDLRKFATKDDLVELKEELQQYIDDRLSHLPTKEEFFERMDMLIGQLRKTDEEQILQSGRLSEHADILDNHEQRIARLEQTRKTATSPS